MKMGLILKFFKAQIGLFWLYGSFLPFISFGSCTKHLLRNNPVEVSSLGFFIKSSEPKNNRSFELSTFENVDRESRTICIPGLPYFETFCQESPPTPPVFYPPWISVPVQELHDDFFLRLFRLLLQKGIFFNSQSEREKSPFNFKSPYELQNEFGRELRLGRSGTSQRELLAIIGKMIQRTPHHSHPFYLHRRAAGIDPYGMIADWMVTVMNGVMLTYLFSPVYTLTDYEVYEKVRSLVGYPGGSGDGMGLPSGGNANSYAVHLALQKKYGTVKTGGVYGTAAKHGVFISKAAHYTTAKWTFFEGLGLNSIIEVETDERGRMSSGALADALKNAKLNGVEPLIIIATAGTPILGSIDPIDSIAQIANENQIWFHLDGNCGGANILSENQIQRLIGVEKSDSFSWGPDCMTAMPIASSVLVTRESNILKKTFGLGSTIEFDTTTLYNETIDLGDHTLQTSRRADLFKIWFAWKVKGKTGLGAHVDYIYENSKFFTSELGKRQGRFSLIIPEFDTPFVSFYYIPSSMRNDQNSSLQFKKKIDALTDKVQKKLLKKGLMELAISSSETLPFANKKTTPNFFTLNLCNSALTKPDLTYILDKIEEIGECNLKSNKAIVKVPNPPQSYPSFVTAPIETLHKRLMEDTFTMFRKFGLYFQDKRSDPPIDFKKPEELENIFDVKLENSPLPDTKILGILNDTIKYMSHQSHPYWLYQLVSGLDPYTIGADIVTTSLTSTMFTYEDSPVFTLAENEVFRGIKDLLKYPPNGDGFITTGGTLANIHSINLARHKMFPSVKQEGISQMVNGKKLAMFISNDAHYSLIKGAFFTGLGTDNCILIDTDDRGRMNSTALKASIDKSIQDGFLPFYVGATAGTTVFGAIDPLEEIASICKQYGLWFHVDASFGGSVLFSDKHRRILQGLEKTDSFNFNPTKMYGAAFTVTVFLTRHENLISKAFGLDSPIDFDFKNQTSTLYDRSFDNGDKHLQTNRRADMFKFWLLWKAKGINGLGNHIDEGFEHSQYCQKMMRETPGFELIIPEYEITNVCFYYLPPRLRNTKDRTSENFKNEMEKISFEIQARLVKKGVTVVVAQFEQKSALFLKLVLMSTGVTNDDIKYIIKQIDFYGRDL